MYLYLLICIVPFDLYWINGMYWCVWYVLICICMYLYVMLCVVSIGRYSSVCVCIGKYCPVLVCIGMYDMYCMY